MKNLKWLLFSFQMLLGLPLWAGSLVKKSDRIKAIEIFDIHSGWMVYIAPDGSGCVLFGSNVGDGAVFPRDTFHFEDLHRSLIPKLKTKGGTGAVAVSIRRENQLVARAKYIDRLKGVEMIEKAQQHSVADDKARFDFLLKEKPVRASESFSDESSGTR